VTPQLWISLRWREDNEIHEHIFGLRRDRWVYVPTNLGDLGGIVPWEPGRLLGWNLLMGKSSWNYYFFTWGPTTGVPTPDQCQRAGIPVRVWPRAVLAFPSGALVVAGTDECVEDPGRVDGAAVERWGAHAAGHAIDVLPGISAEALAGADERDVFLGGAMNVGKAAAALAHFDGTRWAPVDTPLTAPIESLALADDRTLWAVAGGELSTRDAVGRWARIKLPNGTQATNVKAGTLGDVWVEAGTELLTTRRTDRVLEIPDGCGSLGP
jgi:hypothetical protein